MHSSADGRLQLQQADGNARARVSLVCLSVTSFCKRQRLPFGTHWCVVLRRRTLLCLLLLRCSESSSSRRRHADGFKTLHLDWHAWQVQEGKCSQQQHDPGRKSSGADLTNKLYLLAAAYHLTHYSVLLCAKLTRLPASLSRYRISWQCHLLLFCLLSVFVLS